MKLRAVVLTAAAVVLLICVYSFLLGNEVFNGSFENEPIAWYFLAKGIFCSLALYLSLLLIEGIHRLRSDGTCAKCGYDRRGLAAGAVCPECGEPGAAGPGRG